MKFHKVQNEECDFCKKFKEVVTLLDGDNIDLYICSDCAKKILKQCIEIESEEQ